MKKNQEQGEEKQIDDFFLFFGFQWIWSDPENQLFALI